MSTTFQSADHTSSAKRIRQHLLNTEMGTSPVYPIVKSMPKIMQSVKKTVAPTSTTEDIVSALKSEYLRDIVSIRADGSSTRSSVRDLYTRLYALEKAIADIKLSIRNANATKSTDAVDKDIDAVIPDVNVGGTAKDTAIDVGGTVSPEENSSSTLEKRVDTLHVGADFNIPEQPSVEQEGGVHKVSPLAIVVNGGVLLHDIGYTTDKKGLVPLYYDPTTQRALIYQGK